jgi:hypothetical protein
MSGLLEHQDPVDKGPHALMLALSDASVLRFEFRFYAAGQTNESELLQMIFLVGSWRSSRLRLQDYLAASSNSALDPPTFSISKASSAAKKSGYFYARSLPFRDRVQQSITEKTTTPICRYQQDFPITPSELMTNHLSDSVNCKESANQRVVRAMIN